MGEDAQAIRAEIAATREQMGETADAIAYRADVKARTRDPGGLKGPGRPFEPGFRRLTGELGGTFGC